MRRCKIRFTSVSKVTKPETDETTKRVDYFGPTVNRAARVESLAKGGQILISSAAYEAISSIITTQYVLEGKGEAVLKGVAKPEFIHEVRIPSLQREFPPLQDASVHSMAIPTSDRSVRIDVDQSTKSFKVQANTEVNQDFGKEQSVFVSGQQAKWMVSSSEITLFEVIGAGSFGEVYRGSFRSQEVAVKKLIKRKLGEDTKLEFMAECSILYELRHPNIILFMGGCIEEGKQFILTEYMEKGSLYKYLISGQLSKNDWEVKIRMMSEVAKGMNYLHQATPPVIHRDLKSSNLLLDTNLRTKYVSSIPNLTNKRISDFGFARVKKESSTMVGLLL